MCGCASGLDSSSIELKFLKAFWRFSLIKQWMATYWAAPSEKHKRNRDISYHPNIHSNDLCLSLCTHELSSILTCRSVSSQQHIPCGPCVSMAKFDSRWTHPKNIQKTRFFGFEKGLFRILTAQNRREEEQGHNLPFLLFETNFCLCAIQVTMQHIVLSIPFWISRCRVFTFFGVGWVTCIYPSICLLVALQLVRLMLVSVIFRIQYRPLVSSRKNSVTGAMIVLGSLRLRVFETRTATGSELFSLLTCFHTTTFTLLSIFFPLEMISTKIWETPLSWRVKCSLPVAVRVSNTRNLKLPSMD